MDICAVLNSCKSVTCKDFKSVLDSPCSAVVLKVLACDADKALSASAVNALTSVVVMVLNTLVLMAVACVALMACKASVDKAAKLAVFNPAICVLDKDLI